jgi:hypothetical protein
MGASHSKSLRRKKQTKETIAKENIIIVGFHWACYNFYKDILPKYTQGNNMIDSYPMEAKVLQYSLDCHIHLLYEGGRAGHFLNQYYLKEQQLKQATNLLIFNEFLSVNEYLEESTAALHHVLTQYKDVLENGTVPMLFVIITSNDPWEKDAPIMTTTMYVEHMKLYERNIKNWNVIETTDTNYWDTIKGFIEEQDTNRSRLQ